MFSNIKYFICLVVFAIVLVGSAVHVSAAELEKVDDFKLKDYSGESHSLYDYRNSKAIVVMFIATRCPVSNAYNSRMVKLQEDYEKSNIVFLGINSNKQEDIEEIASHSKENGFKFPVLKDLNNVIADKFGAEFTPEVFVLNSELDVLYHGRIDDSRKEENVKVQDLRQALNEILTGKKVTNKNTKAFGCTIKRVDK
jgi:peroxiredoxin